MVAVLGMFTVLAIVAYNTADMWKGATPQTHNSDEVLGMRAASIVFIVLAAVWFIIMLFERKNVNISIKLLALTAEAIDDMPLILLTPVVECIAIVIFLVRVYICVCMIVYMSVYVYMCSIYMCVV